MTRIVTLITTLLLLAGSPPAAAFEPDLNDQMQLEVARAILNIKKRDPGVQKFFDNAAGYAVFPNVGKGGFMIGGAWGKGLVIVNGQVDGYSTVTQFTIGAQIGAQKYSLYLFFKDQVALEYFKRENFEFSAQASAVAVTNGAAANTSYDAGVAVFTIADGGLMAEATIGGQQFSYEPREY
jgi:lipid-binding SYLF domain-containing protein